MIDRNSGIYKIVNKVNGKIYVGSAVDFYERWHSHKHYLHFNNHHNRHLQQAWNKYGEGAFEFIVIENYNKPNLIIREQFWLDWLNCCDKNIGL